MSTEPRPSDELIAHLWRRRDALVYQARLSVLYHLKRERFFDGLDKFVSTVTAVTATAAVTVIVKDLGNSLEIGIAGVTAVLSLIPVIFNPAQQARRHAELASEFRRLRSDCERAGEHWTAVECDTFKARIVEIEAKEPLALGALVADCQNQLAAAEPGLPPASLTWYHRMFKNWWDFRPPSQHA